MRSPRTLLALPMLAAAAALTLSGCTGAAASSPSSSGGTIQVVASTNVYGDIAQTVGGSAVQVTSIIANESQDPHDFEASAADQLTVKNAQLLIENGGGYDPFLDQLVQATGSTAPMITAATLSPEYPADGNTAEHKDDADHAHDHLEGFNEHVFYDPAVMKTVAAKIATELGALDPSQAATFTANAQAFGTQMDTIEQSIATIAAAHAGVGVFVTEPLPLYLTDTAGLDNVTPVAFSEAVEGGQDVPPATLLQALALISDGSAKVVIVNAQAAGAETTQVEDAAKAANVPVLKFSEILPAGQTYAQWMQQNVTQLADALGK
jgi:zinc/manganese transport system substrate-binding protein